MHTDDTTSASSAACSPPFLPSPCPLTEKRSAPAGADDGAAANDDEDNDDDNDQEEAPDLGLWYIHGRVYDLCPFMDQHPGALKSFAFCVDGMEHF